MTEAKLQSLYPPGISNAQGRAGLVSVTLWVMLAERVHLGYLMSWPQESCCAQGMGEGEGKKDVSDQIQDEDQLLGAQQKDQPPPDSKVHSTVT